MKIMAQNKLNYLANALTGISLFCGFVSIIFSLEQHFTFASWAILLSVVFDGLDGQIARRNPIPSEFGKELDSLVDVISFGIATSILGYIFVYRHFYLWATSALLIYLVCSIIRLAKFNITPKDKLANYFYGLPTTASGGLLASFILIYRRYTQSAPPVIFLFMVLLVSFLMISKIRYPNLDALIQLLRKNKFLVLTIILILLTVLIIFSLITSVFLPEITIFALFIMYLLFSPFTVRLSDSNVTGRGSTQEPECK